MIAAASAADPSFVKVAQLLQRYSAQPLQELDRLLVQLVVNVALGNTDAHAKNYSLLHPDRQTIQLSPLYDVNPDLEINPSVMQMGMRIAGHLRIDRVGSPQVLAEACSWGLSAQRAQTTTNNTASHFAAMRGWHTPSGP